MEGRPTGLSVPAGLQVRWGKPGSGADMCFRAWRN